MSDRKARARTFVVKRVLSMLALALCFGATTALAQQTVVTTQPSVPNSGQAVTIVLFTATGCPMHFEEIFRTGNTFDVPYGDACLSAALPETRYYNVGLLAPGTYTVRHFLEGEPATAEVIGEFAVIEGLEPAIPALDGRGAAILAVLLAALALPALRRLRRD